MDVAASWATYRASAGGGPLDFGKQIVGVVGNPLSSVIREGVTVLDLRDRVLLQGGKHKTIIIISDMIKACAGAICERRPGWG